MNLDFRAVVTKELLYYKITDKLRKCIVWMIYSVMPINHVYISLIVFCTKTAVSSFHIFLYNIGLVLIVAARTDKVAKDVWTLHAKKKNDKYLAPIQMHTFLE